MPQRSLLAYAGITQARLIPQLEVAANRRPGDSAARLMDSAYYRT